MSPFLVPCVRWLPINSGAVQNISEIWWNTFWKTQDSGLRYVGFFYFTYLDTFCRRTLLGPSETALHQRSANVNHNQLFYMSICCQSKCYYSSVCHVNPTRNCVRTQHPKIEMIRLLWWWPIYFDRTWDIRQNWYHFATIEIYR